MENAEVKLQEALNSFSHDREPSIYGGKQSFPVVDSSLIVLASVIKECAVINAILCIRMPFELQKGVVGAISPVIGF